MLGTVSDIGLAGREVRLTFVKPAMMPAALQASWYWLGLFVVALYVRFVEVVPLHTAGLLPSVIVGKAFTVVAITLPVLLQPVVVFFTVSVPL